MNKWKWKLSVLMQREKIILRPDTINEEFPGEGEEENWIFTLKGNWIKVKINKQKKKYSSVLPDQKHTFVEITGRLSRMSKQIKYLLIRVFVINFPEHPGQDLCLPGLMNSRMQFQVSLPAVLGFTVLVVAWKYSLLLFSSSSLPLPVWSTNSSFISPCALLWQMPLAA